MAEFKLPTNVHPVIGASAENKSFELFRSGNNVVPLTGSDKSSIEALHKQLGAPVGTATVVGGVLRVSLTKAAEGRCTLSAR